MAFLKLFLTQVKGGYIMTKKIISLIVVLFLSVNVFALNAIWLGTISDDWSLDDNWSSYWMPNEEDMVSINDGNCVIYLGTVGLANDAMVDAGAGSSQSAASLTIKSGASLTTNMYNFELGYTATEANSVLNVEQGALLDVAGAAPFGNFLNAYRQGRSVVNLAGTVKARNLGFNKDARIIINFTERTGKLVLKGDYSDPWYITWWARYWLDRDFASGVLDGEIVPEWGVTYGFVSEYDAGTDTTTFKSLKYVENAKAAIDPVPEDEAIDVTVTPVLSWSAPLKSSGDALAYKVYLSTNPSAMGSGVNVGSATSYDPSGNLLSETPYYWRVDVTDANFGNPITITGDVWTFDTTMAGAAVLVSPTDTDSPEVATNITLNWTSDPAATSHLVYMRERNGAWALVSTINAPAATTYAPTLLYGRAYDWRVDEVFPGPITVTGPTWKFHTITPVCNGGLRFAGDEDGDCDVDFEDFALIAENWMTCAFEPAAACGNF